MYNIKNIVYAEAGMFLIGKSASGFMAPVTMGQFSERQLDVSELAVTDEYVCFDSIRWNNPGIRTYADAKKFVVGKRYSNDDQIAIILNKDNSEEDTLVFQKMQEWRDWASVVAHKIMDCINSNQNGEEEND